MRSDFTLGVIAGLAIAVGTLAALAFRAEWQAVIGEVRRLRAASVADTRARRAFDDIMTRGGQ